MPSRTALLPPHHYLNDGYGIKSWLLTRDHKRIALLYLAGVTLFFFIGGAFAVLIRLELATPAGDLVSDETYNKLFTMHGVMMVFFFLIPSIPAALGVFITGFSSILTGLNFIVTIHRMRAPGMTWFRMPLFLWSIYATSLIMILGTPVIAITILLLAFERVSRVGIFDPALGGDPILFQHLFWFYSHPAVYIMVLPSMGVVSELVACFSHKRIYG